MDETKPAEQKTPNTRLRKFFRIVKNLVLIAVVLVVCIFGIGLYRHWGEFEARDAEIKSVQASWEKAAAQPIWHLRYYKDPMEDIHYTRLEIEAAEIVGGAGRTPYLSLECAPDKKGNKTLGFSIKSDQRLTLGDAANLFIKFDDEPNTHRFEFSADQAGKTIYPKNNQEEFILKLLAANRMRGEIYSRYGEPPFFSFALTPQSMAQNYAKDCWGDYTLRPAAVSLKVAALIWGKNSEAISAYQKAMKAIGLYSGDATGTPDVSLFEALQKYAAQHHLSEVEANQDKAALRPSVNETLGKDSRVPADVRKSF